MILTHPITELVNTRIVHPKGAWILVRNHRLWMVVRGFLQSFPCGTLGSLIRLSCPFHCLRLQKFMSG